MSSTSQDVLNLALDALRREKFGQKAIQIVNILSYFSAENVPTDIFNAEMSQDEVETATSLLKQYLLVDSAYKQDFININKLVQRKIRGCLREKKKEVPVLNEAVKLLIKKGKNPEEFQLLVDHAISVWLHACNIGNLVQKLEALPRLILPSLEKEFRYNEAAEFGWNALNRLKVSGKDNREIVWLQFHLGKLLDIMGKYKAALTILRPLLDRNIMELKLKNEIMHTVISVVKKLQDALQYDEILPVYEKILSDQKIGDTDKEEILCAWHHYALLLIKLDRCDDAVAILNDILKQINLQKLLKCNEIVMMFKEVIEKCENVIGKTHPETLSIQAELALVYFTQNEFKKAAEIFKTIHTNHGEMKMQKHKEVLDELTYEENLQFFESTLKELNDTFGLIAIKRGESFNSVDIHIIHSAIREDDLGKIYTIIQNGIDINCKDSSGNTLLHYAALHGNLDVMKLLLEFGAIYNATNANNKTPLQLAENNSVKMLLNLTEVIQTC
ncbi:tankyrase [Caerostris extrusa]|uniref:Tankyrase n=1 Tax=Caerostris extrusa TaxID=172846 RepID=A0AAV4YEW8_CAEEX|nr:tankyrase [Caerostris extrusa]